jgi:hypothetical protein
MLEGAEGRGHGLLGVFCAGLLMNADDLSGARGVQGADFVLCFEAFAADDQVIFAAQLAATNSNAACILRAFSGVLKSIKGSLANPPWGEHG